MPVGTSYPSSRTAATSLGINPSALNAELSTRAISIAGATTRAGSGRAGRFGRALGLERSWLTWSSRLGRAFELGRSSRLKRALELGRAACCVRGSEFERTGRSESPLRVWAGRSDAEWLGPVRGRSEPRKRL